MLPSYSNFKNKIKLNIGEFKECTRGNPVVNSVSHTENMI